MPSSEVDRHSKNRHERSIIKCVVWDLDGTLWQGTLLNGGALALAHGVEEVIRALDARGILQSIASKNDHDAAWPIIEGFGLAEFFLYPQISWAGKAESLRIIAAKLRIGLDAMAFVDDQIAERDEIRFYLSEVTVMDARDIGSFLDRPDLTPDVITDEARARRAMYRSDMERTEAEQGFPGTRDAFLTTLGMRMSIHAVRGDDLARASELTVRTNQLNTTGRTYSYEELNSLARSPDHLLLVAKLEDRYGSSGTIGLALIEMTSDIWTIRLLIMSCRVMTRGLGTALLGHVLRRASNVNVRLRAAFVHTDRNRQMYMTYKFTGFKEVGEDGEAVLLENDMTSIPALPPYVTLIIGDD